MTEYHAIKKTSNRDGGRFFEWKMLVSAIRGVTVAFHSRIAASRASRLPKKLSPFEIHEVAV